VDTDDRITEAVEIGQKNQSTMGLIRNWCRHARIKKLGGVGIVEQQTGLPIRHHAMACEFASIPGVGTWDLADAALDFYDKNCSACRKRELIGLPNISALVERRDAAVSAQRQEEARLTQEAAERRAHREQSRLAVRAQLGPLSVPIIDAIGELDSARTGNGSSTLLETAKLAPETFTPPIIEYCFDLLEEGQSWFFDLGLKLLSQLGADPKRLVRHAAIGLEKYLGVRPAAALIEAHAALSQTHSRRHSAEGRC
jgi:hypothetical protein